MAKIKVVKSEKKKAKEVVVSGSGAPSDIEGYKVTKIKCTKDSSATHHVLVKEHSVREKCPEKPSNLTLFVRSVPPFVTEEGLHNAFSVFGPIRSIYLHSTPSASIPDVNKSEFFIDIPPITGHKVAYIVFNDPESPQKALLASSKKPLVLHPAGHPSTSLLDTLVERYNKQMDCDPTALKDEVDAYMSNHDQLQKAKEKAEKKHEEDEADDGWVTVGKKGIPRKESVHSKIMKNVERRNKKTQLVNFYRFQLRESKMSQLVKLREKFEEDKKKIAQLKESRKFKPF